MTTLGDSKIVELMSNRIEPFSMDQVGPSSYDVHLGEGFKVLDVPRGFITIPPDEEVGYKDVPLTNGYYPLLPLQFAIGTTMERVDIPPNLEATVEGRSSVGRLGLFCHVTAGYCDPGFPGQITLEFFNSTQYVVLLKPGSVICQLVFRYVHGCKVPYNERKISKYCGQHGPTGSRLHVEG